MSTIRLPDDVPPPFQDCKRIRKAFKGYGTDEKEVIKVLAQRCATQRKHIRDTYSQLYNESLIRSIASEVSGDLRSAIELWTLDPPERDAMLANKALNSKRKGIRELQIIIEIACASPPHHLMAVNQAYSLLFNRSIEEDIISHVQAPVQQILINLVTSYKYDGEEVDLIVANDKAHKLREATESKHLDQDFVLWLLDTRNILELKATFKCYKQKYGDSIDKDIMHCGPRGTGILGSVLKVVALCIGSPEKHFAEVIRYSVYGLGTDEDSLTRAIVTRAEVDMMKIREEYYKEYKSSLDEEVSGDTTGGYKAFLMALLGADI